MCRICGEEFVTSADKPGYANVCMECTLEDTSLRVKEEVRIWQEKEVAKGEGRGVAVPWELRKQWKMVPKKVVPRHWQKKKG